MARVVYVTSYYKPASFEPRGSTCAKLWWPRTELNRRHTDFQSAALPTELLGRAGASGKKTETRGKGARIIRGKPAAAKKRCTSALVARPSLHGRTTLESLQ